ncbi:DUF5977 domain-containing protein [Pedobacter sp. BG31]|uniref:DUF5977 domain-containing protein n=1 Tax=Pedobacter sp. BG31 TaxID=3349697 RepID=UPI0035F3A352
MKKILLALLLPFFLQKVVAQSNVVKFNSPISPSPTAASLGKYGDIPVATYTGIPSIQIPLYEIKIGASSVPVSLSYYAGGFKVADESSSVGLGWSLNAGGVITRVKKMKDDLSSDGYYKNADHTNNDGTDKEPDIFYFNFANFSGKFLIDYSSNPAKPYEIKRISVYDDDDLKIIMNNNQTWTVTDKFGVIYEFNDKEIQNDRATTEGGYSSPVEPSDYVSAWYLSKITYTNGEEIVFNYTTGAQVENIPVIDQVFGQGTAYITTIPYSCYQPPMLRGSLSKTTYNVKVNTIDLKDIVFPGGKIEVNYTADREDLRVTGVQAKRLRELKVFNLLQPGYNLLKTFSFHQSYFVSSGRAGFLSKRLRLDKVIEFGSSGNQPKTHELAYSGEILPDKDSKDIDHWGYFNGPKNNDQLFPKNQSGVVDPKGSSRNPDGRYVKANLLSSILFPSQLSTYFEWEINDFSNLGNSLFWSSPSTTGKGMSGAGVRIKVINSNDNVNPGVSTRKEFEYTSTDGNQSSGKIMSKINYSTPYEIIFPVYLTGACTQYNGPVKERGTTLYSSSSIPISGDAQGNIIGYDRVVVKNKGATESTFSVDEYYNYSSASLDLYPRFPQVNNNMNGLLRLRTDYVNSGSTVFPIRQTEMAYTTKNSNITKGYLYTTTWSANWLALVSYDISNEWIVNSKVTERVFDGSSNNSNIDKITNLSYESTYKQKIQEDYVDSKGDAYMFKYLYPRDMVTSGNTNPYQEMENRYMIGYNIQLEKYKNGSLLEKTFNDYATNWPKNTSLILPSKIRTQYLSKPIEDRLIYNSYDKKGNPILVSYPGGLKTMYLWGYNYQNPIAEIKNTDLSTVESILGAENIDNFAGQLSPDKIAVDNFIAPLYAALPDAQISKYSYIPLVGLNSQTDAKGQIAYYQYDDQQRLLTIKDQNQKIVKSYSYNYAPRTYFNLRREQNFMKDNCTPGNFAIPILFVVPAGQFTSIISQTDADQQAENYLLNNGQAYANANGICKASADYFVTYTVDPYFTHVNYTITKSFDDDKRALCKVRIRYDPISGGGGALTDVIEQVQMERGVLEYSNSLQVNAGTTVEVELIEIIEN